MCCCSPEQVIKKFQNYQEFIKKRFGKECVTDDQELILLSIKSLEVSYLRMTVSFNLMYSGWPP